MKKEFNITDELRKLLMGVKNEMVRCLILIYKDNNNGLLPNWENDEEIIVSAEESCGHFPFLVENEDNCYEEHIIKEFIVTLDNDIFIRDLEDNEFEWTELTTDEIMWVCEKIQRVELKNN